MKPLLSVAAVLLLTCPCLSAEAQPKEEGFTSLFDGKTLDGWKVGDNAELFQVRDGMIVMECPAKVQSPAHLYYEGGVAQHDFKNFDFKVDVMTFPKANSGIFFHTKYQQSDWPKFGIECQIDNSHVDWRRTGSLWGIRNLTWGPETPPKNNKEDVISLPKPPVQDNAWYTQEIIYKNGQVTVKLNSETVLEYTVTDADREHTLPTKRTWLPRGTFALQGHPPMPGSISKVYFKNIRVKVLPD